MINKTFISLFLLGSVIFLAAFINKKLSYDDLDWDEITKNMW